MGIQKKYVVKRARLHSQAILPAYNAVKLTSLSMVTAEEGALSHKLITLELTRLLISRNMPRKVGIQLGQGTTRTFSLLVAPDGRCCLLQAFPEVVSVDGMHETNNESRPLPFL
jgi:hypothetical protein